MALAAPAAFARPETWFHFIGGNVAAKGITADLEAIKEAGIEGIHFFHGQFGGAWPGVEPQIKCLSENWDSLVGFVAGECERLGMKFAMQNCPGWAMSGGPWIAPSNAMRHISWTRTDVDGGKRVKAILPKPSNAAGWWRDWRDIAVIAFPAPDGDWEKPVAEKKIGDDARAVFDFDNQTTVRTLELQPVKRFSNAWCYSPGVHVKLTADGITVLDRVLQPSNWQDDKPVTFAIDETKAKRFELILEFAHRVDRLGSAKLYSCARMDDWEAQAAWTLRRLMNSPAAKQSTKAWVDPEKIADVTRFMKADGTFEWDAPEGRWAIVRVGHVNTGVQNGPAPANATGFECDKLATKGADAQFANYIGRLSAKGAPVHGKMQAMLMDSWECSRQTWTDGLDGIFEKRTGYPLLPHLPAVMGYVVGSPEETARFLDDWRTLLGKLVSENFYARMADHCHKAGMEIIFETSFGDVLPGDIMEYFKHADTPMCEFWQPIEPSYVGSREFKPVRPTISAAHLYDKKRVAAEAFTSFTLTWDEKLRDLKHVANIHMAEGVSHIVFHTYTHNPRTDFLPPGTSFGSGIGTPFLRQQTWWKHMKHFTDYFANCEKMLENGRPARDVLWYLGDESDHKPDELAPFPSGYLYDYCNPDALLTRLAASSDGKWQTAGGTKYNLMWIPECRRMRPETMEKIASIAAKGCKVAFAQLPEGCATLSGGEETERKFRAALEKLEHMAAENIIFTGKPLADVLAACKLAPDAEIPGCGAMFDHRTGDGKNWYFIVPSCQGKGFKGEVVLRNSAPSVEIFDPQSGKTKPARAANTPDGERTRVTLDLAPGESVFIVFSGNGPKPVAPASTERVEIAEAGEWRVEFAPGPGMPESTTLKTLAAWKNIGKTAEEKSYSGTAKYSGSIDLPALAPGETLKLELGRVESIATVKLNGKNLGTVWAEPYAVNATAAAKPGRNSIEIETTDTWFNRLAYDASLPEEERKTWTIAGPKKGALLRDSGLLGPVRAIVERGR